MSCNNNKYQLLVECDCHCRGQICFLDRFRPISDQSGHLFCDWFGVIQLAFQSKVRQVQHFSLAEREGAGRGRAYSFGCLVKKKGGCLPAFSVLFLSLQPRNPNMFTAVSVSPTSLGTLACGRRGCGQRWVLMAASERGLSLSDTYRLSP